MKKLNQYIFYVVLLSCFNYTLYAQKEGVANFDFTRDLDEQLPSLDSIMIIAHQRSPMVLKFEASMRAEKEKISLAKKNWSNYLQVYANYSTGNQGVITSSSANEISTLTTGYRTGVNVSVPLYEFMTRGNRVRLAKAEFESAEYQQQEAIQAVDLEIITYYQKLLLAHKQVKLNMEFAEKAAINERLAEIQLRDNQMKLTDYTRVSEIRALADNRYFESQSNFLDIYKRLELLLGVSLVSLKR